MSSGTRKSKHLKCGRNVVANETSPFSIMMNPLTPLINNAHDKNLQIYTQKIRTDKQDLHEAKTQISNLQKYISNLTKDKQKIKDKLKTTKDALEYANSETLRAYDQVKYFTQKLSYIIEETQRNTSKAQTLKLLMENQDLMIENIQEIARSIKQQAKDRVSRLKNHLNASKLKLKCSHCSPCPKETTASLRKCQSKGMDASIGIQSKEFSRSGEQIDYIFQGQSRLLSLKSRLLSEDEEKAHNIDNYPNNEEDFIGENSVLEPLNHHQNSQITNEPIIPEDGLSFLQNSDCGKITPELYKNMNQDSDLEDSQKSAKNCEDAEEIQNTEDDDQYHFKQMAGMVYPGEHSRDM